MSFINSGVLAHERPNTRRRPLFPLYQVMSQNTLIHRSIRPVIRATARTGLTPNHLTTVRLVTALASAILVGTGNHRWSDIGAAFFAVSFLLDRADGELARQTGQLSAAGHRFDLCSDFAANITFFLGLGFGLRGVLGNSAIMLGGIAGLSIVAIFALVDHIQRVEGPTAAIFPSFANCDPDDAMIIVPIAIWCGAQTYILVAAAIGAPSFFAWTCWRRRRHLAQLRPGSLVRRASIHQ